MTSTSITAPAAAEPVKPRASDAFVSYVLALCATKRVQADLRTGLGQPVDRCNYLHRYLVRRLPERQHPDARRAHYAVAALIAARPRAARDQAAQDTDTTNTRPGTPEWFRRANLGASLAQAVNSGIIKPDSAEGDLHLFTRQSSDALHQRLPALTRHLQSGGIALDWAVLLEDLTWWDRDRDRVATRWLEGYFRTLTHDDTDTDTRPGAGEMINEENN
ncbi:type I-E CRISPR-associated protein Cse2/CasB [Streptomyces sp. NPDC048281]|uniref:type I-E CRISPR-associated protein Cse2/CasB n=1 Tax=Streptomyces sp. NPDC048281 TaxID=3154715 RepID=UPI00341CDBCC